MNTANTLTQTAECDSMSAVSNLQILQIEAFELGQLAFQEGKNSVPETEPVFEKMTEGYSDKIKTDLASMFIEGWNYEKTSCSEVPNSSSFTEGVKA